MIQKTPIKSYMSPWGEAFNIIFQRQQIVIHIGEINTYCEGPDHIYHCPEDVNILFLDTSEKRFISSEGTSVAGFSAV